MSAVQPGLVTTIIPVFNRAALLPDAVESVLAQTYRPIEVIIVDDGSTDGTREVVTALVARHPEEIRAVRQENAGVGRARETGRRLARGEFIQYLDSDDVLLPRKFEWQVAGLHAHPECGVSYGMTRYRFADGSVHPGAWKDSGRRVETMFPSLLVSRWWDTPTPLYRRSVCDAAGPWTDLRLEEDWEYDCRVASLGVRLHYHADFVSEVRDHADHRLCRGEALDPARLRHRAAAHEKILGSARRAGVPASAPEMRHFARALFLLGRQCGAAGLRSESQELVRLATSVSEPGWDLRLYRALAALVGWARLGRIACWSDGLRA